MKHRLVFVPAEGEAVLLVGPESEIYAAHRSVFKNIEKMIEYRESAEPECPGMAFASYKDIVAKYTPKGQDKKTGYRRVGNHTTSCLHVD